YLTFLSKTSIPINLNPIVKIVEEFVTKFIDTLLANIPGGQLGDIAKGGPITIDLGQGIAVTLNTVSAAFAANDNINLRVEADAITAFSGASIPLSLNRLAEPFLKGVDRNIDVIAILERTVEDALLTLGCRQGINNIFPLAADVPYLALNVGLDEVDIARLQLRSPSSKQIQDKVAAFASKLLKDGYGSTVKEDSITALSKARVLLPSKSLITEKNVEVFGDLTLDGLLKRLDVRGGKVRVDAAVGLKADLGFAGLTATLDSTRLVILSLYSISFADAAIPSGISVRTIDGSVVLNLGVDLFLDRHRQLIETFADSKPTTFTSIGGASKVVFGVSATDYIDTLSGAALELNLDPFLQPAKKMVFEIIDARQLVGFLETLLQRFRSSVLRQRVNGQDFILPVVNDFTFQNGVATAKADIGFIENDPLAQQLWILVGNVVFHRAGPTNLFVTGYGVVFGSSASKAYDLASKASINIYLDSFVKTVFDYFDKQRPVELKDIQAQILNEGIRTNIICSQLPELVAYQCQAGDGCWTITWRINGVQEPAFRIVDAIFTNIQVTPGKPITFDLLMSPDPSKETGFLKPLEEAIPFLVQFKDYAQFAYLGRVDVYEKGFWPNPGPLHLDVGVLSIRLESEGDPLLTIESPGPVIVKNVNEGRMRIKDVKVFLRSLDSGLSASLIPGFNKFLRAAKAKIEQYPAQHWNFVEEL
ncbi:hypothetical protein BC829DRAFT_396310, partial [Chytridium lagenaria]